MATNPGATAGGAAKPSAYDPTTPDPIEKLKVALEGRYTVERELGRGGMATVYLARDIRHDREVAIKVLLPELSASIGGERFEREIKTAAKLHHPHILGLFDSGSELGLLYYVMPFVKGESLRDKMDREGPLSVEEAILVTMEVADALTYAHGLGIVHRDIKPENIMLSDGHALIADFGIARAATDPGSQKLTQTGMALGTPTYMSPEQSSGDEVGPAADIYSLACVVYEMLAGEPPYTGKNSMAIMARHSMESIPSVRIVRSAVPEEIENAIFAGMGKTPADRPKTAKEFAEMMGLPMGMTANFRATATRRLPSGTQYRFGPGIETRKWWMRPMTLVPVVAIVVGGILSMKVLNRPKAVASTDPNARRVAVLYFTDESPNKDLGPLADGLTENLINSLSNALSLTVISRSGSEKFRGSSVGSDSIARALRAGYLVRGFVGRDGKQIKVTASLEDGSGTRLASDNILFAETDLFAMRDSLAGLVSTLIKSKLRGEIQLKQERAATSNEAAWLELQRGEQARKGIEPLVAKGDPAEIDRAVAAADSVFANAEKLDPKWAEPMTRRALVAYRRSRTVGGDPGLIRKWVEIGLGHANRALALDPGSPDALEVRGTLKYWSWVSNLEVDASKKQALLIEAKEDLDKATELNPKQASAWATLVSVHYQLPTSKTTDAFYAATKAYETDEFLANANVILHRLVLAAYDLADFDKADQYCKIFAARFPSDYRSKRCRLFMLTIPSVTTVDLGAARRLADSIVAMRPPKDSLLERLNTNLLIAAAMGRASKTQPALADSAKALAGRSVGDAQIDPTRDLAFYGAFVYSIVGDTTEAIENLKRYLAANPQRAAALRTDPGWWFKDLSQTAPFKRLVGGS